MIRVGNRYKPETLIGKSFYCGRGTPLGNKHHMVNKEDRDRVCDLYDAEFLTLIKGVEARMFLIKLYRVAKKEDITLVCSCYPLRCHCDTIKHFLDNQLVWSKTNEQQI